MQKTWHRSPRALKWQFLQAIAEMPKPVRPSGQYLFRTAEKFPVGATVSVRPAGEILMSFDFNESTYRNIPSTDDAPTNAINREWSGTVNLNAGQPVIAGATQNQETTVFLIISADVMGR